LNRYGNPTFDIELDYPQNTITYYYGSQTNEEPLITKNDEMMRQLDDEMIVGVVERGSLLEKITITPNPTTGELTISPAGGGKGVEQLTINNVEVFDIYGKCHLSLVTRHESHITLNISYLSAGLYFVKISTEEGMVIKKIVKQ